MRLTLLLMTVGGSVAQASLVSVLAVNGVAPDVPLVITILVALRQGPEAGCVAGFLTGLFQDVTVGGLVGVQALSKALVGFGLGLVAGRLWVSNPLVQVLGLVVLTVAEGLLRFGVLQLFHFPAEFRPLMLDVILPQAVYNGFLGAAGLVAMSLADRLRARLEWR